MKKSLFLACAALVIFSACNKEPVESEVVNNQDVVLSFTSTRPQLEEETKTEWNGSTIVWSEGDMIRVGYTLDGNWMGQTAAGEAKFYQSQPVSIDENNANIGTFNVPITGGGTTAFTDPEIEGSYVFYAIYPHSSVSNTVATAPNAKVTLKSSQNPTSDSFDSSTDIMVGKTAEMDLEGLPTDPLELVWSRVVAHGYFTLKDIQGVESGETITKVTLTAQEGAALAGEVSVSLEDGSFTASNATNEIVINGSSLAFVEESGMTNLKIWLSVLPETLTALNVEILTNKATYTREISGISKTLKQNARNLLAINMASATRTKVEQVEWVKKNITAITASDVFVIVGNNGNNYALNSSNGTANAPAATAVTVNGDKLATNPIDDIQWTVSGNATDGYTFYPNGTTERWLYCTNTNNGVRVGTNDSKTFKLDQGYLKHDGTSRYIGIYNSADWRCYTSNGGNIANQTFAFYVKTATGDVKETPTISFNEPTTTVNIGETVTNEATIDPSSLAITYSSSDEEIATVDATGTVTGVAVGVATITASFAGDDTYEAVSESYEITVVDPNGNDGSAEKPYLASEAAALALGGSTEEVYVKGIISTITTPYNSQYGNVSFDISDDGLTSSEGQFRIYRATASSAEDFKVGDYVVFKGKLTVYSSTPELESGNTMISQIHAPVFSPESGSASSVTISADNGATIRYTTDGTNPTATTGTVYSSAIVITETTTIKAIAIVGEVVTGVVSGTYTAASADDKTATFVFNTDAGLTALGITKPEAGNGTNLGSDAYVAGDVSMVNTTNNSTETRVWNSSGTLDLRIYKGSSLTFSVDGTITSIALTGTTVNGFTVDSGSFSQGTWTGNASSVTFTATATEKINTITVTYK